MPFKKFVAWMIVLLPIPIGCLFIPEDVSKPVLFLIGIGVDFGIYLVIRLLDWVMNTLDPY